jgi:hypothetical protein
VIDSTGHEVGIGFVFSLARGVVETFRVRPEGLASVSADAYPLQVAKRRIVHAAQSATGLIRGCGLLLRLTGPPKAEQASPFASRPPSFAFRLCAQPMLLIIGRHLWEQWNI